MNNNETNQCLKMDVKCRHRFSRISLNFFSNSARFFKCLAIAINEWFQNLNILLSSHYIGSMASSLQRYRISYALLSSYFAHSICQRIYMSKAFCKYLDEPDMFRIFTNVYIFSTIHLIFELYLKLVGSNQLVNEFFHVILFVFL